MNTDDDRYIRAHETNYAIRYCHPVENLAFSNVAKASRKFNIKDPNRSIHGIMTRACLFRVLRTAWRFSQVSTYKSQNRPHSCIHCFF